MDSGAHFFGYNYQLKFFDALCIIQFNSFFLNNVIDSENRSFHAYQQKGTIMNQFFQKKFIKKQKNFKKKFIFHSNLKWIGLFALLLSIAGGSILGYRYVRHKKAEQRLETALQVEGYDAAEETSAVFGEHDCTNLAADLLHHIWPFLTEHHIVVSEEQKERIRRELSELIIALYKEGLVSCDASGAWTDLSKTYLANALSFAVLSVTGNPAIEKEQMIISDMTSTLALDQSVNELKKRYQILIDEIRKESADPSATSASSGQNNMLTGNHAASSSVDYDLSNIKTQLEALQSAQKNNSGKMEAASQLALRLTALETLVNTIRNTKVPAASERNENPASEASDEDTSDLLKKIKAIQQTISSLSGKLNKNTSSDSSLKQELQKEITQLNSGLREKQAALVKLQSQMVELERSAQDQRAEISRSVQNQQSQMNDLRDRVSKELTQVGKQLNEELEKEVTNVRSNVDMLVQEQQEKTVQWAENAKNLISELEKNMEHVVEEAEKRQTASEAWLVDVVINVSDWEAVESGYIYQVSHQRIHEQHTNIYLTFAHPEQLNDLSYVQKEGMLEIISPCLPEQEIVISTIKIENPISGS